MIIHSIKVGVWEPTYIYLWFYLCWLFLVLTCHLIILLLHRLLLQGILLPTQIFSINMFSMGFILWSPLLHRGSHFKTTAGYFTTLNTQCASRPLSLINFPVRNSKRFLSLIFVVTCIFDRTAFANFKVYRWKKNVFLYFFVKKGISNIVPLYVINKFCCCLPLFFYNFYMKT